MDAEGPKRCTCDPEDTGPTGHMAGCPKMRGEPRRMGEERVDLIGAPSVAGVHMERSIADFVRGCDVLIHEEQAFPIPDTALIGILCDAVRLAREHTRMATAPQGMGQPDYMTDDVTVPILRAELDRLRGEVAALKTGKRNALSLAVTAIKMAESCSGYFPQLYPRTKAEILEMLDKPEEPTESLMVRLFGEKGAAK